MSLNNTKSSAFLKLTRYLLVGHPFFAQLLATVSKKELSEMQVPLAIGWQDDKPILLFQETLLRELTQEENLAIQTTLHELLHLLLGHCALMKWPTFDKSKTVSITEESSAYHLAADLEVWRWLGFYFNDIPDYLKPFQSLIQQSEQESFKLLCQRILQNKVFLSKAVLIDSQYFGSHQYWTKPDSLEPSLSWQSWWITAKQSLDFHSLEEGLCQRLEQFSKLDLKVSWQRVLRQFASNASSTYNKSSLRRPSKRYGTIPSIQRKRRQQLLIIIDTSGSVNNPLLHQFFTEIQWIFRQGAKIDLLQADQKVQDIVSYNGELPNWIWGRGATSFDPALQYANEHGPFDGVLYFTDGQGAKPTVTCRWPLLWVVGDADSINMSVSQNLARI